MTTAFLTKRFVFLLTVIVYCLSGCLVSAQTHSGRAKALHSKQPSHHDKGRSGTTDLLPYPFPELTTLRITSVRGTRSNTTTIILSTFWTTTPGRWKHYFSKRGTDIEWLQYVQDHLDDLPRIGQGR